MAVINFEQSLPVPTSMLDISASVDVTEGPSINPPGEVITTPPTSIQLDQPTIFTFNWSATGFFAPFLTGPGRNLKFDVFYELMGPDEATFPIPSLSIPYTVGGPATLTVLANTVNTEGVYRVVVRMMYTITGQPSPICGFVDLGLIEYYAG